MGARICVGKGLCTTCIKRTTCLLMNEIGSCKTQIEQKEKEYKFPHPVVFDSPAYYDLVGYVHSIYSYKKRVCERAVK